MKSHNNTFAIILACLTACSGGQKNQWQDIDYSSVYRRGGQHENDPAYTQPSVVSCIDEDLFNCR